MQSSADVGLAYSSLIDVKKRGVEVCVAKYGHCFITPHCFDDCDAKSGKDGWQRESHRLPVLDNENRAFDLTVRSNAVDDIHFSRRDS